MSCPVEWTAPTRASRVSQVSCLRNGNGPARPSKNLDPRPKTIQRGPEPQNNQQPRPQSHTTIKRRIPRKTWPTDSLPSFSLCESFCEPIWVPSGSLYPSSSNRTRRSPSASAGHAENEKHALHTRQKTNRNARHAAKREGHEVIEDSIEEAEEAKKWPRSKKERDDLQYKAKLLGPGNRR